MAALRASVLLALLGLSAAAGAQSSDLQSLVQKNVGVHAPDGAAVNLFRGSLEDEGGLEDAEGLEDSLEVPPRVVLQRLPMEMIDTAKSTVVSIWSGLQRLLDLTQAPFLQVLGVNGPDVKERKAQELMELFTGYVVAFKDGNFPAIVNATIESITHGTASVGERMAAAAVELVSTRGSSQTGVKEHAAMRLEHAAYEADRAYADAAAKYFQGMQELTQQLPTQFLWGAAADFSAWLDATASAFDANKTFTEKLKPVIKGAFTKSAACGTVREQVPNMDRAEASLRAGVPAAVADIRNAMPELDFFAAVVAKRRSAKVLTAIPQALAGFNYFLDATEASMLKFADGLHVLSRAMAEVAAKELNCTLA